MGSVGVFHRVEMNMSQQDGVLVNWDDARGFGFIEPDLGGPQVFVHAKAFVAMAGRKQVAGRPEVGMRVRFTVETTAEGKKRAQRVSILKAVRQRSKAGDTGSAQWGTASYFALFGFVLVYLLVGALWQVPHWVAGWYAGWSLLCFVAYAWDKAAARADRRRTPEDTLHGLALMGGWPGALVAQQVLRHKSAKTSFRRMFWLTVLLNVAAFVGLNWPAARAYLPV